MREKAKRIWAKIVVLHEAIERFKEHYPSPRTRKQQDIIHMFETRIISETKKLKELDN